MSEISRRVRRSSVPICNKARRGNGGRATVAIVASPWRKAGAPANWKRTADIPKTRTPMATGSAHFQAAGRGEPASSRWIRSNRLPLRATCTIAISAWRRELRRKSVWANAAGSSAAESRSQINSDWASNRPTAHHASGFDLFMTRVTSWIIMSRVIKCKPWQSDPAGLTRQAPPPARSPLRPAEAVSPIEVARNRSLRGRLKEQDQAPELETDQAADSEQ